MSEGESARVSSAETQTGGFEGWAPLKPPLWLCLPTWLGAGLFLLSFPLYRPIPVFRAATYAEVFFVWWILADPLINLVAIGLMLSKRRRLGLTKGAKIVAAVALTMTALVNAFFALGMWAAFYY
jgi:hypothetical protein